MGLWLMWCMGIWFYVLLVLLSDEDYELVIDVVDVML